MAADSTDPPPSQGGPRALKGLLGTVSGTILAAAGVLAAVDRFQAAFKSSVPLAASWPQGVWWLLSGILSLRGIWQIVVARRRRSELLRLGGLRLERDNPE